MSPTHPRGQDKQSPYVGYFRGNGSRTAPRLFEPNSHPHVGVYRHSPAKTTSNGLQEILRDKRTSLKPKSVISTLQLFNSSSLPKHLEKKALELMPSSHFKGETTGQTPMCPICLENFVDGDEIRNLKCSHCFHKSCVDIWLLGTLSNDVTTTVCPTCRQDASSVISDTRSGSSVYNSSGNPGPISPIPDECFLRVGQFLLHEGSKTNCITSSTSDSSMEARTPKNQHSTIHTSPKSPTGPPPPLPPIALSRSPPLPPLMSLPPSVAMEAQHQHNAIKTNNRSPTAAAFLMNSSVPSSTTLSSSSNSTSSFSGDSYCQEDALYFPALDEGTPLTMDVENEDINYRIVDNNEEENVDVSSSFMAIDMCDAEAQ